MLGGKPTPGIGFGTGIERIIINLKRQEVPLPEQPPLDAYIAYQGEAARTVAYKLASDLRLAGRSAVLTSGGRSFKSQLRHADSLGARYAAIIGERELADHTVSLKDLQGGEQVTVPLGEVVTRIAG
jgi:histidyl-tRNA synthetase